MEKLMKARKIMTEYFKVQGYARIPMDYADKFLLDHYKSLERDDSIIKESLRKALRIIAAEVMNPDEIYPGLNSNEYITAEKLLNKMTSRQLKAYCKERGIN